jgi:hypothetical protein
LGSLLLFERLGIDLAKAVDAEWQEDVVLRYLWAHGEDLDTVLWSTWDGSWEDAIVNFEFRLDVEPLVVPVLTYVERIFAMMDALWVKVQPRPQTAGAEIPPPDLLAPDFLAALVADAGACLPGMSERDIFWDMPGPRVVSYHHVERWKGAEWTIPHVATRGSDEQLQAARAALEAARASVPAAPQAGMETALGLLDRLTSQ